MSGRNDFRLERVLKYREDREKEAQKSFIRATDSLNESRRELTELQDKLAGATGSPPGLIHRGLDMDNLILCSRYAGYLTGRIKNQEKTVVEKQTVVQSERVVMESKMRDRKILESLKEKEISHQEQRKKLDEQKQNDEFAVTRFGRGEA